MRVLVVRFDAGCGENVGDLSFTAAESGEAVVNRFFGRLHPRRMVQHENHRFELVMLVPIWTENHKDLADAATQQLQKTHEASVVRIPDSVCLQLLAPVAPRTCLRDGEQVALPERVWGDLEK